MTIKFYTVTALLGMALSAPTAAQDELEFLLGDAPPAPVAESQASHPPAEGADDVEPTASEASAAESPAVPESQDVKQADELLDTVPVGEADAPPDTIRARPSSRLVEEIVVTAQKREENVQDVPIAIAAFSAEKLDALGVQTIQQMEKVTPGFTVTSAAGFNVAYLRGVGTDAFLPGADPSVPFYLDGVNLLSVQGSADTLGFIERVEVLKGPQGTLFGRNATGGAVNVITADPHDEFAGTLKVELAQYNERNILASVNLPIFDTLALSLSGFNSERDNYYVNDAGPIIDVYSRGGRAKARWDITDSLSLTGAATLQKASNNSGLSFENTRVAPVLCPLGVCVLPQDPAADRQISADSLNGARYQSELYALTLEWNLPWSQIKVIGSDQILDAPFVQADFDKSALPIVNIQSIQQIAKQQTLEVQILSNEGSPWADDLQWVAGLYYLDSSGGFDPIAFDVLPNALQTLGIPLGGPLSNILNGVLTSLGIQGLFDDDGIRLHTYGVLASESYSAYAQGTWFATETFDVTLGLRYQTEKRDLVGSRTTLPNANGNELVLIQSSVPQLDAKQLSPRVALQWRPFGDFSQIYASWSRAYKSPTYNTVNLLGGLLGPIEPVEEEQVDSYELGFKSDLFGGALRLNGAVFFTEQKNLLTGFVAVTSGGVVTYDNAGNAEIFGVEADVIWTPMPELNPGLALTAAASYLDTEYTSYPEGKGYDEATGLAFGPGLLPALPARDLTGNRIVRTPEWTYTIGANQSLPIGENTIEIGFDLYHNSGFYFLPQNSDLYARESYHLWTARVSYFYTPWNLQLTAYGANLADETYNEVVFVDDFGRNQVLNDPRVYGLRVNWSF